MTRKHYVDYTKNMFMAFAADLLLRLISLFLIPILTKKIGALNYGVWTQVVFTISMILPLVYAGLYSAMARFISGHSDLEARQEGFYSIFYWVSGSALVASVLLCFFSTPLAAMFFGGIANAPLVRLGGVMLVAMALRETTLNYFRVFRKIFLRSVLVILETLFLVGLAALIVMRGGGVSGVVKGNIVVYTFFFILELSLIIRDIGFKWPSFSQLKAYLSYGIPLIPTAWFVWAMHNSDRYIIAYYKGMQQVGVYSACYSISFISAIFYAAIFLLLPSVLPYFWDLNDMKIVKRYLEVSLKYGLILTMPTVAILSAFSGFILRVLTTQEFMSGAILIPIVGIGWIFYFIAGVNEQILVLAKKTELVFYTYLVPVVINITLNLLLVPRYGMLAAAITSMLAYGSYMLTSIILARRYLHIDLQLTDIFKVTIAALAMFGAIELSAKHTWMSCFYSAILGSVLYIALIFIGKIIRPDEKEFLFGLLKIK